MIEAIHKIQDNFFTFHYVSINTSNVLQVQPIFQTLHSTIFLLIQIRPPKMRAYGFFFTFHYVSINTRMATQEDFDKFYFTFHYVSINTRMLTPEYLRQITLHSTMFLLILP